MTQSLATLLRARRRARAATYIATAFVSGGVALAASSFDLDFRIAELRPILFCAAVGWSFVASVRLAEGKVSLRTIKDVYGGAQAMIGLWAIVFVLLVGAVTVEKVAARLPNPLWTTTANRQGVNIDANLK